MRIEVIVLAAGQGKRMYSSLPKVLHPLAGRPLLGHVLAAASALNPAAVHVVHGHGGAQVLERFADAGVRWAEQAVQLGTGHAVAQALPAVAEQATVLVLYGDVPLVRPATLAELLARAEEGVGVLTVDLDQPAGYGRIVRDDAGRVVRIVEEKDATSAERHIREVNTGIVAAPAVHLRRYLEQVRNDNAQGEYYLTDIIELAVAEGTTVSTVAAAAADDVLGVNDRVQLAHLERVLQRRQADALLRSGVLLADPARFDLRGSVEAGRDVSIDVGVVLEGTVRLGDGARIGPNCVLRDVTVDAGAEIRAMSVLEGCVVGPGCIIGPFARVRPGTTLAARVHVGNFVEVKNSRIGEGSKANHLSYVGDTDMGAGVNVGAGTITCNYDGANKFRTVIGDDVFIGSDTQLVAPVTVGAGATIGAGSTITRDVPPGELALSRVKQTTVPGWKRPVKRPPPDRQS